MTDVVVKRVVAEVLRCAVADTWGRNEERRVAAWDFLYSSGAGVLFLFFGLNPECALRAIVEAETKPIMSTMLSDGGG